VAQSSSVRVGGMITDPVYEGKSLAGMIDMIKTKRSSLARESCTPTSAASRR